MITALAMLAALEAGSAAPAPAPKWRAFPTGTDVARFFPNEAQRRNLEGIARIACGMTLAGETRDCRIAGELPLGLGFGEAALKLAPLFKTKPTEPPPEEVPITIRFTLPKSGSPINRLSFAMFCYGRAHETVDQDRTSQLALDRMNYWSGQVLSGVGKAGYEPANYEAALAFGRLPAMPNVSEDYAARCDREGPKA